MQGSVRPGRAQQRSLRAAALAAAVLCAAAQTCPTTSDGVRNIVPGGSDDGVPGPELPDMTPRPMRTYGAVGSCAESAAEGFDGGEIVVAATLPLHGPASTTSYAKIMRYTIEIFLDWLNLERELPNGLTGGLMVGGKRYSMRFVWTGDGQDGDEAAPAIAHGIRREDARFAWGGYGSTMSRMQARQTELDGVLMMASIAAAPDIFAGRDLTFGALPPDYTYIQNAVRAVAAAAAAKVDVGEQLKVGLLYQSPLDDMCAPIAALAQSLGMVVAQEGGWRTSNALPRNPDDGPVENVLNSMQTLGVNFIVACVYHDGGEAIIEGLERLDYAPHAAAFTSTVDIGEYQRRVKDEGWWQGEYALGVSPWHSALAHAGEFSGMTSADYLQRYADRSGGQPSYHGPAAFSAACALAKAIEDADSLDASAVAASLGSLEFQELGFHR
jgi:ABC-type branched-subunit amino acid transport system substrate-binding protein